MGIIFKYIRSFYDREFNLAYLLAILVIAALVIYLNYWHNLELKLTSGQSWLSRFAGQYLIYFVPFAIAFLIQPLFVKNCNYLQASWFWIILFCAPAFFAFRMHFDWHRNIIFNSFKDFEAAQFAYNSLSYIIRLIVTLLPVLVIWMIKDRGKMIFYGSAPTDAWKPYFIMLLLMIPLIAMASTQRDFTEMYPRARFLQHTAYANSGWRWFLYELCYGVDFITVEFFFRGFLILALYNICGMHAIIPAAVFYCTIHFGKPLGECISSFWGGLLLGIVSYHNFSVWGGLVVHLGIAWLMELGGWLGGLFFFSNKTG